MTDEEAMSLFLAGYTGHGKPCDCTRCVGFTAGFMMALAHARQWRPLTDDPKSWPEEGQEVVLTGPEWTDVATWTDGQGATLHGDPQWTHYLPLPDPPQKGGG